MKNLFKGIPRSLPLLVLFALFATASGVGAPGDLKWRFSTAGRVRSSPALAANGWIVFASMDSNVYALHPAGGAQQWKTTTTGPVVSTPAIGSDGTVFIGCQNGLLALEGTNGHQRWLRKTGEVISSPVIADDTVYLLNWSGIVEALEARTGNVRWTNNPFVPFGGAYCYSSPVLDSSGKLVVSANDQNIGISHGLARGVDASTGAELWRLSMINSIQATPAIDENGAVYLPTFEKIVYALNPVNGSNRWTQLIGDSISSSPAIGPDGTLYVGANDGRFYALDLATGVKKWSFLTGDTIHSSPAIAADRTVYFGSYDTNVYAIDGGTGAKKWSYATRGLVLSSPLIGPDGTVYIGSFDGNLYAFEGSAPPAETAWSMFKGNPRRTGWANDSLPVRLGVAGRSSNGLELSVSGRVGHPHQIQYADQLPGNGWKDLTNRTLLQRTETVLDPQPPNDGDRFYRARSD